MDKILILLCTNSLVQLLCDFRKGSSEPFNLLCTNTYTDSLLSLWILNLLHFSACSLNFGQSFTPKQRVLSFPPKVLLQMRHLSSYWILDKLKKKEGFIPNAAIYLVIFMLYHFCSLQFLIYLRVQTFSKRCKTANE